MSNDSLPPFVEKEPLPDFEIRLFSEAKFIFRFLAFFLDFTLIFTLTMMLLTSFILPNKYPKEVQDFNHELQLYTKEISAGNKDYKPVLSDEVQNMVAFIQVFLIGAFSVYFLCNEILFRGGSLGKKVFSIRVIDIRTTEAPTWVWSLMRALIKTFTLASFFPILLVINYLIPFFNKHRLAGHDYICKTVVIDGDTAILAKKPKKDKRSEENDSFDLDDI